MAAIVCQLPRASLSGFGNPALSAELHQLDPEGYAPNAYSRPRLASSRTARSRVARALQRMMRAPRLARSFHDDFYERVRVRPARLDLGSLANTQLRDVYVWNAYTGSAHTVTGASLANGGGITVTPPAALPVVLAPMEEVAWTVQVTPDGPPTIDATLTFDIDGLPSVSVRITGLRLTAWPVPPDWRNGIGEALEWKTDLQRAFIGTRTAIPCRAAPRREWEFDVLNDRRERRVLENMLYDWAGRVWALPVWADVEWLQADLPAGAQAIPIATAGLDYRAGGLVMLWSDVQRYELAEIAQVEAQQIVLKQPTVLAWGRGARTYPCRAARLLAAPELRRPSNQVSATRARFEADEPCDWPAMAPATTYLGIPVLEERPDESDDPRASPERDLVVLDGDVGLRHIDDLTELAWQRQSHAWFLSGRAARAAHRSLLYWLQGQAQVLWLPTWSDDVELVEPTGALGDTLTVAWAAITRHLHGQAGRRHLRIELADGRVFYRRVSGSTELEGQRERLLLDSGLGEAIAPQQVRLICWMTLSHLASDRVEIDHDTDSHGLARCRVSWLAAAGDEP